MTQSAHSSAVEREWLPSRYVGEIVPSPRTTPSDWIVALPGDVYALAPFDDDDAATHVLKVGDVVEFHWTETYETIFVTIKPDGSYTPHTSPDLRANCVMIKGDFDTIDVSVEAFAKQFAEDHLYEDHAEATPVEVLQFTWSTQSYDYRFEASTEGPRFVPVNAGEPS